MSLGMRTSKALSLIFLAAASASAQTSNPADLANRAAAAMGGAAALRSAITISDFQTAVFGLGQEETWASPARATLSFGKLTVDWAGKRRVLEQESRAVTGAVTRSKQVVAGGIGMNEVGGNQNPLPGAAVANVVQALSREPSQIVLSVIAGFANATPLPAREFRGEMMDGFKVGNDEWYFDRATALPVVMRSIIDDGVLGDRVTLTYYTRWRTTTGPVAVTLPGQVDIEVNGRLNSHTVVTSLASVTEADAVFDIPAAVRDRAQPAPTAPTPAPVTVNLVELAPRVWRAEGGSHHSLIVDQDEGLVVFEAPQSAARATAVLDTLKSRFPGKSVRVVVNSHHHWDHSGGVRGVLARGIPIITHQRNLAFVRSLAAHRKTVAPDAIDRGATPPRIFGVSDTVLSSRNGPAVHLLTLPSGHAHGILAVWVPDARLVFVVDVLTPGPSLPQLGSAEVLAWLQSRNLAAERIVGGHGGIASRADLEAAAAR